jgi:hypothetical protein
MTELMNASINVFCSPFIDYTNDTIFKIFLRTNSSSLGSRLIPDGLLIVAQGKLGQVLRY